MILTLTNTFFIFFIFQANHNRCIAEYQKENLETSNAILERWVDERVSELIETNISLHQEIFDRKKAEEKLKLYQDHLEELVEERTHQLSEANSELYQFNRERVEDIIKLRQTEMALRESEDMFRKVSQSLMEALIVINGLGHVVFWSKSAERIFGYTEEDVIGHDLHTLIMPNGMTHELANSFAQFRESGEGEVLNKTLEFNALRKNGENFPVEVSIVAIKLKGEWSAVGTVRDMTSRRQKEQELQAAMEAMEQANHIIAEKNREISDNYLKLQQTLEYLQTAQRELVQSEKMAALGQLIAGVAHEINTPLGAISSSVSSIDSFVHQSLASIPEFFRSIPIERQEDFFALLHHAVKQHSLLTSKEKRKYRKELTTQLYEAMLPTPELLADKLVEIGIYHNIVPWMPLLQSDDNQKVLDMAYQIIGLQKSTATIATASERAAKVVFALKSFSRFDHSGKKVLSHVTDGIETVLTLYYNKLKFGVEVVREYVEMPKNLLFSDELKLFKFGQPSTIPCKQWIIKEF
ncbi:MAG: PAS domain S-box protein [Thiotrichaceae bacterium]